MKYIDDLSYSGLVTLIDGSEIKGADVLNNIAHEMEENKKIIEKLEKDLERAKNREGSLIAGTQRVMQHLKKIAIIFLNVFLTIVTNGWVYMQYPNHKL